MSFKKYVALGTRMGQKSNFFSDIRLEACAVEYYPGQLKSHAHRITWLSYNWGFTPEITARENLTRAVTTRKKRYESSSLTSIIFGLSLIWFSLFYSLDS